VKSLRLWLVFCLSVLTALATNWPIPPVTSVHPLGNNWGNFQNYGGSSYFHPGIDVITPDTAGAEVRAVRHGWVKAWGTIQADLHYRVAVCDTNSSYTGRAEGWLYAHVDAARWHKNTGDEVQEGELIGYLVDWPLDATFDHCHFARISDTGATWMRFPNVTWWFIQNPLTIIRPNTDNAVPVFENARSSNRFAICRDNVNNSYIGPTGLTGDVDIIAKIYDKTGTTTGDPTWDELAPLRIEHMIRRADGLIVRPWTRSVDFSNRLDDNCINVIYKDDNTCNSRGDYDYRDYYFIVTNTDGDSIMETTDAQGKWATASVGDGTYWILVRAWDAYGNSTTDSMQVTTANGVAMEEAPFVMLNREFRAFPNPSPGRTCLEFGIGRTAGVKLRLFDNTGRLVRTLADGRLACGKHQFRLDGLATGIYLAELELDSGDTYRAKLVVMEK